MQTIDQPTLTASLDNEPWEFDIIGFWVKDDGIYLSTDSGCSCPTPWESHTEDDLTGPLTYQEASEEALSLAESARNRDFAVPEVLAVLSDLRNLLDKQ